MLACLAALALAPQSIGQFDVRKFYSSPSCPESEDTQAIQRAVDECLKKGGGEVELPWMGRSYVLKDTIQVDGGRAGGDTTLRMQGDGPYTAIRYRGPANRAAFRIVRPISSQFNSLRVYLETSNTIGFDITGAGRSSTYDNFFLQCRTTMKPGIKNCIGFALGNESGDTNSTSLTNCQVYSEELNTTDSPKSSEAIARKVGAAGHIGFAVLGGNTLTNALRDCMATGCRLGVTFNMGENALLDHDRNFNGAGTNLIDNFNANFCGLVFQLTGGTHMLIRGGRAEHSGALLLVGPKKVAGPEDGQVQVEGYTFDDPEPMLNEDPGLGFVSNGTVVGLYFVGSFLMRNCTFGENEGSPPAIKRLIEVQGVGGVPGRRLIEIDGSKNAHSGDWTKPATWQDWIRPGSGAWKVYVDKVKTM